MDDFPAGPASSPEPRRRSLSVVIPVNNGGRDFERCLRRLRDSSHRDYELIVVDDGSTDNSAALAERFGAKVLHHPKPLGPAAARNSGAKESSGSIVFFLDADVAVHGDTLDRVVRRFETTTDLSALFGSYDDAPEAPGVVSRYRNLLHHFVHQQGDFIDDARPVHTFWTGCGAIRRDLFLDLGGFDPERYRRPAIEDIELGYRVHRSGGTILLARDVQATHLKRWSLYGVLKTDILCRGVPWMLLIKRMNLAETDLNVSRGQRASVLATGLGAVCLAASVVVPAMAVGWLVSLGVIGVLNRGFHRFLYRKRGLAFASAGFALHYLYFWCCGISVVIALGLWHLAPRETVGRPISAGVRLDGAQRLGRTWRRPRWKRNVPSSQSSGRTADAPPSRKALP